MGLFYGYLDTFGWNGQDMVKEPKDGLGQSWTKDDLGQRTVLDKGRSWAKDGLGTCETTVTSRPEKLSEFSSFVPQ